MRKVRPMDVRIVKKSCTHSLHILITGEFNPSGMKTRAYHERNFIRAFKFVKKHKHLLNVYLK